jgi:hypothetical protein
MDVSEQLEVTKFYCRLRPPDTESTVEAVEHVARAIAFCRERQIPKLLVDWSSLTRVALPTLVDRFLMVEDWAQAAKGAVVVALITPPELIHPQKFGAKVAAELGLRVDGFSSEREAVVWLLAQAAESGVHAPDA